MDKLTLSEYEVFKQFVIDNFPPAPLTPEGKFYCRVCGIFDAQPAKQLCEGCERSISEWITTEGASDYLT